MKNRHKDLSEMSSTLLPMKNTTTVPSVQKCYFCNKGGFFVYTPRGGDFETCPCCGNPDEMSANMNLPYDFDETDMRYDWLFCKQCSIIYKLGCTHAEMGGTDGAYNAHVVKQWQHKVTGEVFQGMPLFESVQEWYEHVNDVLVLEEHCPNGSARGYKTSHKITEECDANAIKLQPLPKPMGSQC